MRNGGAVIAVTWLLVGSASATAAPKALTQLTHRSWSAKDGVPPVRALAQTADGYLWLGTLSGLMRFDGVRFVRWQPPASRR